MKATYNITERKPFIKALEEITGAKAVYLRTPTYAYAVDYFTVTREGNLECNDMADPDEFNNVLYELEQHGFFCKSVEYDAPQPEPECDELDEDCPPQYDTPEQTDSVGLTIQIPLDKVAVGNLTRILEVKGALIRKALAVDDLPLELGKDSIGFPWFSTLPDADTTKAYLHFISALCEMSIKQKRINASEKTVDNEKYAFRCFLLRLEFIGEEYKAERKILLKNLSGSSAFKNGGVGHE